MDLEEFSNRRVEEIEVAHASAISQKLFQLVGEFGRHKRSVGQLISEMDRLVVWNQERPIQRSAERLEERFNQELIVNR